MISIAGILIELAAAVVIAFHGPCCTGASLLCHTHCKLTLSHQLFIGAGRGSRTPKGRSPADFESAASASSAIPAL